MKNMGVKRQTGALKISMGGDSPTGGCRRFFVSLVRQLNPRNPPWGLPLVPYSPVFFSPVFLCLPSAAKAAVFKTHVPWRIRAEVSRTNRAFLPVFLALYGFGYIKRRCIRLSGVKVPRPASPFITHETPIRLIRGMAVAVSRGRVRKGSR